MDYPTAVREGPRRVGITIPERSGPTGPDPREPLYAAVATAADWFARQLRESPEAETARKYLESRHVTMEQAQVGGLGFGPRGTGFLDAMKGLGLREEVLLEAGLVVKRDDGSRIPRFRGRLLFPIHDLRSRVVAFSGRILGEGEPKYLNSPETAIFHKGQLLYNLHLAKHGMRKAERAILVEGLERKIQILERKGFFGSLPGRRRALDRLLPTIRAAADPITRDLYISRVAEVAGIRKDVLQREVDPKEQPTAPYRPLPPVTALPSNAEKALLQLMMAGEPWRARVIEAIDSDEIEFPVYRSLFEALADDAPDRLDETAARAYESLHAEGLGSEQPDVIFERAVNRLEARRLDREIERINRALPFASDDEKANLAHEKQRLAAERNAKRPTYGIIQSARRKGAPGS